MTDAVDADKTSQEVWEEHNEGWSYDAPEEPPELWSSEQYTELYDRMIGKRVQWTCQKCSQPFSTLEKARRHMEKQHMDTLLNKHAPEVEG